MVQRLLRAFVGRDRVRLVLAVAVLMAGGPPCVAGNDGEPGSGKVPMRGVTEIIGDWHAVGLRSHPLVGKVWSQKANGLVGTDALIAALRDGGVVLTGELHDNNDHHRIQARLLKAIVAAGVKPGVVFEQLRADQQAVLSKAQAKGIASVAELKALVDWQKSGWHEYNYDPMFQAVLDDQLEIYAGDVTRDAMMKVVKGGAGSLPLAERKELGLDRPLGDKLEAVALEEVYEAHCRMIPKEALAGMAFGQRFRDAHLADVVLRAAKAHGGSAVLFAGDGHVRRDRGVPWYIRERAPNEAVVAVVITEVEGGKTDPSDYIPRDPDGKPAADFVIFTPRTERGDPCEEMRAQMQRKKKN